MTYTEQVHTHYGDMLVPRFDTAQTPALRHTGRALCHQDIEVLRTWLSQATPPGPVLLDIGANIGSFSFACQDLCSQVHAFEPQRLIFNMLAGSIALNGWQHVFAYHLALGSCPALLTSPRFDFHQPLNFGGVEFGPTQNEFIGQPRQPSVERVRQMPLDTCGGEVSFARVDVMKIDVEGMELEVLAGAKDTIARHRPRILIEHAKAGAENLRPVLERMGYDVEPHGTMDFACTPRGS